MRSVLITGCSSGFGRLAAEALAAQGHQVWATMRNTRRDNRDSADGLRQSAAAQGWNLTVVELDVTSDASVAAASARILRESKGPDVIINNAGQMYAGVTEAFTAAEFHNQLNVNVLGIHRVCRAFLPAMRERGSGLIINLSSIAGRMALPFFGLYHASKWAVEGYSLGMRRELACAGIDVVVVEPGPFTTQLFPESPRPQDEEGRAQTYPAASHETFAGMGAAFEGMFNDPAVPTDPDDVVRTFVELIDMTPGARPFRSVVGVGLGIAERNVSDEAHDPPFLEALGLDGFATLAQDSRPLARQGAGRA